jgi:phosphatidylserine/phosphatidylglycerophosphate/cardiolipin synthase-like enzyme
MSLNTAQAVNWKTPALPVFMALLLLTSCATVAPEQPTTAIEVHFSPNGGCTDAIVRELDAARETVLVQAYEFTSPPIAKALTEARKRGVKVQVILDKSQWTEKDSSATFLQNMGVPTFVDELHGLAHNKVMVIDGKTVITGSFNFTRAAEEFNAENLLVIRNKDLAAKYAKNWQRHLEHSVPYERKAKE